MLYPDIKRMRFVRSTLAALALVLMFMAPPAIRSQDTPIGGDKPPARADVVTLAAPSPPVRLLPDTLGGLKASSDTRQAGRDNIADIVRDKAPIYQEYLVVSAASRDYSGARVEVFEAQNQFAALGLFTFNSGASKTRSVELDLGSGGARCDGEVLFWKGPFFVRIGDANQNRGGGRVAAYEALARAVANGLASTTPGATRPPLFDSLPNNLPGASLAPQSQRYFLGPESLNTFIAHGREMFEFVGDTEAVIGEYSKPVVENRAAAQGRASGQSNDVGAAQTAPVQSGSPTTLIIVECHTPEFATDELARVTRYVSSLSEIEQQQIVFKRTGNYIVAAMNVRDREFAESLVNSVQYPYTVKWLRNPLWQTNDPFRAQKAAEMLLSTFGLLGLILLTVLVGGTIFGTSVFLKRRKQQREIFSDAGGMLRLDIEPFVLALPPERDK